MIVLAPDRVDVEGHTGGKGERFEQVVNHLGRDCHRVVTK